MQYLPTGRRKNRSTPRTKRTVRHCITGGRVMEPAPSFFCPRLSANNFATGATSGASGLYRRANRPRKQPPPHGLRTVFITTEQGANNPMNAEEELIAPFSRPADGLITPCLLSRLCGWRYPEVSPQVFGQVAPAMTRTQPPISCAPISNLPDPLPCGGRRVMIPSQPLVPPVTSAACTPNTARTSSSPPPALSGFCSLTGTGILRSGTCCRSS
jgi:hypothetical protein